MKKLAFLGLAAVLAISLNAADSDVKTTVKSAAKKLAAQPNYSWTSTSRQEGSDQGRMTSEGKTEKSGLTQLAITFGDRTIDVALKGNKVAVKEQEEWKSADELEGRGAGMARRFQDFKAPAAEAEDFADKAKELKSGAGGVYSGDLTSESVKEMFARFRRPNSQAPEAKDTKGWVKFWLTDGVLTKYEYNVQGKITVGQDGQEMEVNRTTTVEIKDVGKTTLSVPEAARKKLS